MNKDDIKAIILECLEEMEYSISLSNISFNSEATKEYLISKHAVSVEPII